MKTQLIAVACVVVPLAAVAFWARGGVAESRPKEGRWTRPLEERRDDPFPRLFVNAAGEQVEIPAPPQKIVSGTVFSDAILLDICPPDRIAALHEKSTEAMFSPVHERSTAFPRHHGGSPEEIFLLEPDLVIVSSFSRRETRDLLGKHGCSVLRFMGFDSVADIQNNVRALGYVLGLDEAAERVVANMQARLDAVASGRDSRRDWRVMYYGYGRVTGSGTTFQSLLDYVGARNVADDLQIKGSEPVSNETVLIHDPEVIILACPVGEEAKTLEQFTKLPGFEALRAVREDRVLFVPSGWLMSTSHHAARAAERMAEALDDWRGS